MPHVKPLLDSLEFIADKTRQGFPFRRRLFEIDQADFTRIAKAMKAAKAVTVAS